MIKKVKIKLTDWDHTCGDGCCYDYGVDTSVNGEMSDNPYIGDNVQGAIEFLMTKLGIEFEFI